MNQQHSSSKLFGDGKNTRVSAKWSAITLLLLALLVTVNALMTCLPSGIASPNLSGSSTFRVSGTTIDWLKTLNEDVTLYFICDGGRANADGDLYSFLKKYDEVSDHVSLKVIDPEDNELFINAFGGTWPSNMSVIVESAARYRILDKNSLYYYYFYNSSYGEMTMTPEEYQTMQQSFAQADSTGQALAMFVESTSVYFDGESRVTNAINYVTQDKVAMAYVLTGNGASTLDSTLTNTLSQSCYELRTALTLSDLPEDCDLLVINAPTVDLTEDEATALSSYLSGGGKLFLTTYYNNGKLENLNSVLNAYGLSYHENHGVLCDGNPDYYLSSSSSSYEFLFKAHIASAHAATGSFDGEFVVMYPHAIATSEVENVTVTPWLYTSGAGYLQTTDGTTNSTVQLGEKGEYTFGAIAESGETEIIWIASPYAASATGNAYAEGGNFELILSALNQMTGIGNDGITVASAAIDTSVLAVSVSGFVIWSLILVILIPVAVAVTGGIIWYKRKKK